MSQIAVTVSFSDENGNPLPPLTRVDFYPLASAPGSASVTASAYVGASSQVTVTLTSGAEYRIQYVGTQAPANPSFLTASAGTASVQTYGYTSPFETQAGYSSSFAALQPRGRYPDAALVSGGSAYRLFYALAAVLVALDQEMRTLAAEERLDTSTVGEVDSWATDFLDGILPRLNGEADAAYIARIKAWLATPFGTLAAIQTAVDGYFRDFPDESTSHGVFDRQSDPQRAAYYGLTAGQVAIIAYYEPPNAGSGWFLGQEFLGQDTWIQSPYGYDTSQTPLYAELGRRVNLVKALGAVPVYIASRGEPPGFGTWDVPDWNSLVWGQP